MTWSDSVNGFIYQFVALVLQAAQAHNVTTNGGVKYNVPSGNITIDGTGNSSSPSLTSYSTAAIIGADDFDDEDITLTEAFDIIVNITRQVTPTCTFLNSNPFILFINLPLIKLEPSGTLGMYRRRYIQGCFLMVLFQL